MFAKVTIIGGDKRNEELLKLFVESGTKVKSFGLGGEKSEKHKTDSLIQALEDTQAVIVGIPAVKEKDILNATEIISVTYLINSMNESQVLFGGAIPQNMKSLLYKQRIKYFDLTNYEEFAILNAIPTAEGAIKLAIEKTDITLHSANILICGFGRIGKILAKLLKATGANVTVSARNIKDFSWIYAEGYNSSSYEKLNEKLHSFDIIFNTVPYMILDKERLGYLNSNCLVIDLASKPGGVQYSVATTYGINALAATGLPGKIAPKTCAKYIFEMIQKIEKQESIYLK